MGVAPLFAGHRVARCADSLLLPEGGVQEMRQPHPCLLQLLLNNWAIRSDVSGIDFYASRLEVAGPSLLDAVLGLRPDGYREGFVRPILGI